MACVVLDYGGVDVMTHELIGDAVTIGRAPSNDIVIDHHSLSPARPTNEIGEWVSYQRLRVNKWDTDQWCFY
jgi:hypothetical protein